MAIDTNFYKQKKGRGIYYSSAFLVIAIITTVALFFYNRHIENENATLVSQVSQRNASIKELKQDKNIEAYHIYNLNQDVLKKLEHESQIARFIKHALSTMIQYDLAFEGFQYNAGTIDVNAIAESNEKSIAYAKVITFLSKYNLDEKSLFTLSAIENFSGQDSIKFPIKFEVK